MKYNVIVFFDDPLRAGENGGLVRFSEDSYDNYCKAFVKYIECIELIENSGYEGKSYKVALFQDDCLLMTSKVTPCFEVVTPPGDLPF